jgi:hypothetical protein
MKTPEAIIVAAAVPHGDPVIKNNEKDFMKIRRVKVCNPNKYNRMSSFTIGLCFQPENQLCPL